MRVRALSASVAIVIVLGQGGFDSQQAIGQQLKPEGILEQVEEARLDVALVELKLQQSEATVLEAMRQRVGGPTYGGSVGTPVLPTPAPYGYVELPKPDYEKARATRLETSRALRKAKQRLASLEERLRREQPQPNKAETSGAKPHAEIAKLRAEAELLQLETEAAKSQLVELMRQPGRPKLEPYWTRSPTRQKCRSRPRKRSRCCRRPSRATGSPPLGWRLGSRTSRPRRKAGDHEAREIFTAFMGTGASQLANLMNGNDVIPAAASNHIVGVPVSVPDPAKADGDAQKKLAEDMKAFEAAEKKCDELKAKHRDNREKLLKRKKESFAKAVRELNEKRLALAEAEKQARQAE